MSDLVCLLARCADEEEAATWLELLGDRGLEVQGSIESHREGLWIQGDREVEESPRRVEVRLWIDEGQRRAVEEAVAALAASGWPRVSRDREAERRVAEGWRAQHAAFDVGARLRIAPPWLAGGGAADRVEVLIEPGAAFGGGTHATTRLCLEALEVGVVGGERVLDFGCGTGILALSALALGASRALGVDREEAAIAAARTNALANGLADRFEARLGARSALPPGPFDLVVANVFGGRLVAEIPALVERLSPGALLVLGGLLPEHEAPIKVALGGRQGLEIRRDGGFACLTTRG